MYLCRISEMRSESDLKRDWINDRICIYSQRYAILEPFGMPMSSEMGTHLTIMR